MPKYPAGKKGPVRMPAKDPDARIDYEFDWSDWLQTDENISGRTIEISSGSVAIDSSEILAGAQSVRVWLSGGTVGEDVTLTCRITTDSSPTARIEDRSMLIEVAEL